MDVRLTVCALTIPPLPSFRAANLPTSALMCGWDVPAKLGLQVVVHRSCGRAALDRMMGECRSEAAGPPSILHL